MHTYSNNDLENFHIQQQAEDALQQGVISSQTLDVINQNYPCGFYSAGGFIRIALSLLCVVCIAFAALLFFLVMNTNNLSGIFLILLIACYGLLEFMVKTKKYYNSGIDNTLQVFTIIFFSCLLFNGDYTFQDLVITTAVMIAATWLFIRFTDSFMALVAFAALLVLIFLFWKHNVNVLYMPFILMLASAIIYLLQYWLQTKQQLHFYVKCFSTLSIATLITFYAAINVYIVIEVSKQSLIQGIDADKGYIITCWILSILIPFTYLFYGFIKKHSAFLRVGFLSLCATIVTMYYYTSFLSAETALIIAGFLLSGLGYAGLKYFKKSRLGFTAKSYASLNNNLVTAETLISIQLGGKHAPEQNITFGGGSSGGAGASGNW